MFVFLVMPVFYNGVRYSLGGAPSRSSLFLYSTKFPKLYREESKE